jgi:peptidylprolyl isomerase
MRQHLQKNARKNAKNILWAVLTYHVCTHTHARLMTSFRLFDDDTRARVDDDDRNDDDDVRAMQSACMMMPCTASSATTTTTTVRAPRAVASSVTRMPMRRATAACVRATARDDGEDARASSAVMKIGAVLSATAMAMTMCASMARADSLPEEQVTKLLCDDACVKALESVEAVTAPSGLVYKDIKVGDGEMPPVGYQVVVDYIAMDSKGRVFENSLEKGKPNDIRVLDCVQFPEETCPVIPGLADGLLTMRSGGIRRMYIPGELSFPKGLASAPGRPAILPFSPVTFDVALRYIPGFD